MKALVRQNKASELYSKGNGGTKAFLRKEVTIRLALEKKIALTTHKIKSKMPLTLNTLHVNPRFSLKVFLVNSPPTALLQLHFVLALASSRTSSPIELCRSCPHFPGSLLVFLSEVSLSLM